LEHLYHASHTA